MLLTHLPPVLLSYLIKCPTSEGTQAINNITLTREAYVRTSWAAAALPVRKLGRNWQLDLHYPLLHLRKHQAEKPSPPLSQA